MAKWSVNSCIFRPNIFQPSVFKHKFCKNLSTQYFQREFCNYFSAQYFQRQILQASTNPILSKRNLQPFFCPIFSKKNVHAFCSPIFSTGKCGSNFSPLIKQEVPKTEYPNFSQVFPHYFSYISPPFFSCFFSIFLLGIIFPLVKDTRTKVRHDVVVTILHPLKILHVEESATRHELTD